MNPTILRAALVLGLLSAIGPFAIDMYLPALPAIGASLGADTAGVQASLMAFMAAIAVCQLFYGPVSDMVGRKPPLYFGLALFTAGGIACALAPSIEWLVVARFVQGIGACAAMALPRAIVRDGYTGADAAQLQSLLMLVFSVSPILAPLGGSLIVQFGDWRVIFYAVAGIGLLGILLVMFFLKETRPASARLESSVGSAIKGYGVLLRDRNFLGLSMIGAFGMASFMAYLANSSFILIDHYGLNPTQYSIMFSINAVSFIGVSQLTGVLTRRFGLNAVVRTAVNGFILVMMALAAVFALGVDRLDVLAALLFVGYGFLGLVIPTTAVLALEEHGTIAGTASALMGTLQLVTAAVVMGIVGSFFDGTARPMVLGIAACAVIAFALTRLTIKRSRAPLAAAAE
ncbi:Drug resistance transporter, Bcr/CflA subfamily [Devosia sp. LC5]|uniref:multidrug effflux MFS transporter n=1 Tax=Devosia sp. LC5 TaxID=1502724 RepID=UPI0004E37DA9|nr:multidrug effflux MFS transporter [Devosia sp. LC5]KFC66326.1 Drug resistance transporter, Bcr/CflA subfamily [Devosia sp. LC5]